MVENKSDYVLQLKGVTKSFGQVKVLKDITFSLKKGEILGIVGENGAGKSTIMNILGGIYQKDEGKIFLNDKEFNPQTPKDSQNAGIAFVHQELNIFTNLTVTENLFIMDMLKLKGTNIIDKKRMDSIAKQKLLQLGIDNIDLKSTIEELSMGQRQLVEITKSIMRDANIIIFDEPTTSLSNKEKLKLFDIMHLLKNQGRSIIFISHILEDIFEHCDEIVVIRDGEVISQDLKDNITKSEVIRRMVGRDLNKVYPTVKKEVGEIVFEAKNICQEGRFENINLQLREGEIVGLFGLMGAGRTELLRCLFGLDHITSGSISYKGRIIQPITPENCIKQGMAFITENRHEEGLLLPKTVKDNIVLANLKEITKKFTFIDKVKEQKQTNEVVNKLNIKTYNPNEQIVANLSGGNQQKVVFGKWFLKEPKVFFLDEPTRGVDVGAKYEIYNIINDLAKDKSTILMVSSEMEELMGMCDRILVMHNNKIKGELKKDEYNQESIMRFAIGG